MKKICAIIGASLTLTIFAVGATIHPVAESPQSAGDEFWVEVKVEEAVNLFGVSFILNYDTTYLATSKNDVVNGDFLGDDTLFYPNIDEKEGKVAIGITRKRPAGGVDGSGTIVKVKFTLKPNTPDGTNLNFTITDLKATNPNGEILNLNLQDLTVQVGSSPPRSRIYPVADSPQKAGGDFWVEVKVEDVAGLFGVSFILNYDSAYLDTKNNDVVLGNFLGNDLIFYPNVDDESGKVAVGITRKRGVGGIDGTGIIAKVKFKLRSDVPNGTNLNFTITDLKATDPKGNNLNLTSKGLTVQAISLPYGDVSGNGVITAFDASLTLKACAGLITLTDDQKIRADVDGDDKITLYDVILILKKVTGIIKKFPIEG